MINTRSQWSIQRSSSCATNKWVVVVVICCLGNPASKSTIWIGEGATWVVESVRDGWEVRRQGALCKVQGTRCNHQPG